jgi:hypothetical protein
MSTSARACPGFPPGTRRPLAARQHLVARRVVERQRRQIEIDAALLEQLHRDVEHGQRLQAEEVEFHEARLARPISC